MASDRSPPQKQSQQQLHVKSTSPSHRMPTSGQTSRRGSADSSTAQGNATANESLSQPMTAAQHLQRLRVRSRPAPPPLLRRMALGPGVAMRLAPTTPKIATLTWTSNCFHLQHLNHPRKVVVQLPLALLMVSNQTARKLHRHRILERA